MSRNRSIVEKFFRYTAIGLTAAAVMHASYAAEFNSETMKKMGVFLSNFTETGLRNFNLSELTGTDQGIQQIVMFAYNHIRINTPAKYISEAQEYYNLNRVSEKDLKTPGNSRIRFRIWLSMSRLPVHHVRMTEPY